MRSILQNKKGQIDYPIITFAIIIIGLLIFAPIMLKIFRSSKAGFDAGFGNLSAGGEIAQQNYDKVMNTAINFWDKVIVAVFFLSIILLFVSAFFIDANPFFVILYIFISFMLILFAPNIISAVDKIYDSASFAQETAMLSFMDTIRVHYAEFLVGIIVITGIIIFGKLAFFRNQNGGKRK